VIMYDHRHAVLAQMNVQLHEAHAQRQRGAKRRKGVLGELRSIAAVCHEMDESR